MLSTMKALAVVLGIITATLQSSKDCRERVVRELGLYRSDSLCGLPSTQRTGVSAGRASIMAYTSTGKLDTAKEPFMTLGTRVLLTCDVTELPENSEVVSYRWYHNCTKLLNSRCEIEDLTPYYRVLKDTLLVDVTSMDQGGKYYCFTIFSNAPGSSASTAILTVKG